MVSMLYNETIEFRRKTTKFFSGLAGVTNAIAYSDSSKSARITVFNSSGITASLTFNGLLAGVTVSQVVTLSGDDDEEATQLFDNITDFSSLHASQPSIEIGLVTKQGEPIEREIAVLTTLANFSVRRSSSALPTEGPGVLPNQESVVRIPGTAGVTVAKGDFFKRFNENFQVGEPEPIRSLFAGAVIDHYEFKCNKIT